jgi:hypothetical protein
MNAFQRTSGYLMLATCLAGVSLPTWAAELKPGDLINAANIDKVKNDTFEGKTIASMLTDKLEWQIRNWGLVIKLRHSEEMPINKRDVDATEKYAKDVKFDPATNEVTGYKAGRPFPVIDMNDPKAGYKLVYNYYYQNTIGHEFDAPVDFMMIDGEKGQERLQRWTTTRYMMKNQAAKANPVEGDGSILSKTLLYAVAPFDIKGLGTFSIRYDSPQLEDNWAYIKSVRRTRRLSGGSWMDTMVGDQLQDEYDLWNARPSWYPEIKLVGKRWILAVLHTPLPVQDDSKKDTIDEYPRIDIKNKPFWNPIAEWEPREVYVIEATPPQVHPYGKKVLYMETKFPRFYMGEYYDKTGQFWKFQQVLSAPTKGDDGYIGLPPYQGHTIDFKRKHATVYFLHPSVRINRAGIKSEDVTLGVLEAAGK